MKAFAIFAGKVMLVVAADRVLGVSDKLVAMVRPTATPSA